MAPLTAEQWQRVDSLSKTQQNRFYAWLRTVRAAGTFTAANVDLMINQIERF